MLLLGLEPTTEGKGRGCKGRGGREAKGSQGKSRETKGSQGKPREAKGSQGGGRGRA